MTHTVIGLLARGIFEGDCRGGGGQEGDLHPPPPPLQGGDQGSSASLQVSLRKADCVTYGYCVCVCPPTSPPNDGTSELTPPARVSPRGWSQTHSGRIKPKGGRIKHTGVGTSWTTCAIVVWADTQKQPYTQQ